MKDEMRLEHILSETGGDDAQRSTLFALLGLGIIESLSNGVVSASDAVGLFFNADNCLYVRKNISDKSADRFMGHGVQLPDLFDALSPDEAYREFQHELSAMRSLALALLDDKKHAA
jgi:hypothetical protein